MLNKLVVLLSLAFSSFAYAGQKSDLIAPETATGFEQKTLVTADHYMVVTANLHASKVAHKMLKLGGSAIDAAIAAQLVLGLVEPQSSGLGGGAFILYYQANNKKLTTFDARETAPLAIKPEHFLDENGHPLRFYDAVVSARSVATPATVKWMIELHKKYGVLPLKTLFKPAIELSTRGFKVSSRLAKLVAHDVKHLAKDPEAAAYFLPNNGQPIVEAQLLKNHDYAKSLIMIEQSQGRDFYQGRLASAIVEKITTAAQPGLLSLQDLKEYNIIERPPVCSNYQGYRVCGMGAPSSGAYTIGIILGLLEGFDLARIGADSVTAWRLIADASRLAFSDRNQYIADTDFYPLPLEQLLQPAYLTGRRHLLMGKKPLKQVSPGKPFKSADSVLLARDTSKELPSTSHLSIVDAQGNIVSMTSTIENMFGSRIMVGGFLLNNELTDFSFVPEQNSKPVANRIAPAKRPRSSMSPTIIFDKNDDPYLVLGSPGGSRIINFVAQTIINHIDWKMPIDKAIAVPHKVNQYGVFLLEENTDAQKLQQPLERLGYKTKAVPMNSGLHLIQFKGGKLLGAVDPRREGVALGE